MTINSHNQVEKSLDMDEKIAYTLVQKEVNLGILQQHKDKEMTILFHVKIQVNNMKIDTLFDSGLQENIIAADLDKILGME